MEMLNIIYLFMIGVFVTYITIIWYKYGIQSSISDSYYRLPIKYNFLFTLFCWGFSIPAIIIGVVLTNNFIMFLAGAGIGFVGAAAAFKENLTRRVHMIGAYSAVFLSQLSIAIDFKLYYFNIVFITIIIFLEILAHYKKISNKVWWEEIVAFIMIVIILGINLYK